MSLNIPESWEYNGGIDVRQGDWLIARVALNGSVNDVRAIGHRIAAAPDMLDALESMQDPEGCMPNCGYDPPIYNWHSGECNAVRTAIAKARGSDESS